MRVIVFGGSGFVGSHVADALTAAGHETTVFDLRESPWLTEGQQMVIGDMADLDTVAAAPRSTCTATPPTATLVRARVAGGTTAESAGTLTMYVDVAAPQSFLVEVQALPAGPGGLVTAFESPVIVSNGVARLPVMQAAGLNV